MSVPKELTPVKCKECGKGYDKKEVRRILGKESTAYLLGFCSARCFTLNINRK